MKVHRISVKICLALSISVLFSLLSIAQEDTFKNEIKIILDKYPDKSIVKGNIVFTGSSSIRLWENLENDFPDHQIINTGFGGSQTHEILQYIDETILRYAPSKIFMYVGENDIQSGKSVTQIINEYQIVYQKVVGQNPDAQLFLISAKPSPSRWDKKEEFILLNKKTFALSQKLENMTFISIWEGMLDDFGNPNDALFVDDQLHMNKKGYSIWVDAIKKYL